MNQITRARAIAILSAAVLAAGCSTPSKPASTPPPPASSAPAPAVTSLEGAWTGTETTPDHEGPASMTISGHKLEFHAAGDNDWIKGTFTLHEDTDPKQLVGVVTDCPDADYIGGKTFAIYKFQDGSLVVTGNAPGVNEVPSSFTAPNTRQFIFKRSP